MNEPALPRFPTRLLLLCFMLWAAPMAPARVDQARVPAPQQLAPGVYALIGNNTEPAPENHGAVGNQGILIGDDGVILIDTGTSARYVSELIDTVRRLTPKPVVLAINTHQNPAFIFGNDVLAAQGVPILAHRDAAELIGQRCDTCLQNLIGTLGADEMQGTKVAVPTRIIGGATTITVAGRTVELVYFGHSSSAGSIGVLDRASGVLFAGGLVALGRVPDTRDAHIGTWLSALEALKKRAPRVMVPGEGPVAPVARADELARYLVALQSAVERTLKRGVSLNEAAASSALPQFAQWPLYRPAHNRNVEHLYLQLERENW